MSEDSGRRLPQPLQFDSFGSPETGYIATTQFESRLPFAVKRVFWTFGTPARHIRGNHAHRATHELLVAITGKVRVVAETEPGRQQEFILDSPDKGLHIPPMNWIRLYFEEGTVMLGLSSGDYNRNDYIEEYSEYSRLTYGDPSSR